MQKTATASRRDRSKTTSDLRHLPTTDRLLHERARRGSELRGGRLDEHREQERRARPRDSRHDVQRPEPAEPPLRASTPPPSSGTDPSVHSADGRAAQRRSPAPRGRTRRAVARDRLDGSRGRGHRVRLGLARRPPAVPGRRASRTRAVGRVDDARGPRGLHRTRPARPAGRLRGVPPARDPRPDGGVGRRGEPRTVRRSGSAPAGTRPSSARSASRSGSAPRGSRRRSRSCVACSRANA